MIDIIGFTQNHPCILSDGIARQYSSLVNIDLLDHIGSLLISQPGYEFRRGLSRADAAFGTWIWLDDFKAIAVLAHQLASTR